LNQSSPANVTADMVAVDRAAGELRRNCAVVIDDDRGAVLAQAAEAVTADNLASLARLSDGGVSLALTARRASLLRLVGAGPGIVIIPIGDGLDGAAIRSLIDPTCPGPGALADVPLVRPEIGDSRARAAVMLAKLAQLLPAALIAPLQDRSAKAAARLAAEHDLLRVPARAILHYPRYVAATLQPVSEARVPLSVAEDARVVGFRPADGSAEQFAIVIGDPAGHQPALCRLHSECFTGDLLGSLRCDCGPQL
jgi:GTP cyclohydrolase II